MRRHPQSMGDSRARVAGIVQSIDSAREDLLAYTPPWVDPAFESLRIVIDRALRTSQLSLTTLIDEIATASTEPPTGS
jgi:hypothetical protein